MRLYVEITREEVDPLVFAVLCCSKLQTGQGLQNLSTRLCEVFHILGLYFCNLIYGRRFVFIINKEKKNKRVSSKITSRCVMLLAANITQ